MLHPEKPETPEEPEIPDYEIPDWVPKSVKSMAKPLEIGPVGQELGRRLLTDPRMKTAWETMRREAAKDEGKLASRLAALHPAQRMETWGVSNRGVALPDQACAAFFCCAVQVLCVTQRAIKRRDMLERAGLWRSGAELCHAALADLIPQLKDSELERALTVVGKYFDGQAQHIIGSANRNTLYVLKRSSGRRNDDTTRVRIRALAMATRAIFGTFLYGTLVTVATVALGTKKVTEKSVINWCSDLPCQ